MSSSKKREQHIKDLGPEDNWDHAVLRPRYYLAKSFRTGHVYELLDVIEAFDLHRFGHLEQSVQYIFRAGRKSDNMLEDLHKAMFYLNREIENQQLEQEAHSDDL